MRTRSIHFVFSGALGGLVGFALMELVFSFYSGDGSRLGTILDKGFYFAGFGLAVGAALGMTEGVVRRNRKRLWYGLAVGLLLGTLGGFAGGAVGQALYGLVPVRYAGTSHADVVVVLDSSGSMRQLLWLGSDPWGQRKKAAAKLVDRLSSTDRVAVVDFDDRAQLLFPLTSLGSSQTRNAAKVAIARVDDTGGTNLTVGLHTAIQELLQYPAEGRDRHVIFLTDGQGEYDPAVLEPILGETVRIHTVGLGSDVDAALLSGIARQTGGGYYPVAKAGALIAVFEKIFSEHLDLTEQRSEAPEDAEQLTHPVLLLVLRILGWAAVGLALGLGQGVRENTREDLRACGLGGLLGGALGGALFDPVSEMTALGAGMVGRALADVVVGASIGGTLRMVQARLVEASGKPTTTLVSILPGRETPKVATRSSNARTRRARPVATESPGKPAIRPEALDREPLSTFQERYEDHSLAMARAYEAGYSLSEIAGHFGVSTPAVKRAADRHGVRRGGRLTSL